MGKPRATTPAPEGTLKTAGRKRATTIAVEPGAKRKTTRTRASAKPLDTFGNEARFEFTMQEAKQVLVAGTFNNWTPQPLEKITDSVWATHFPLKPGRYEYRFVVDGAWQEDPNSAEYVPNPFGGRNSVLIIP